MAWEEKCVFSHPVGIFLPTLAWNVIRWLCSLFTEFLMTKKCVKNITSIAYRIQSVRRGRQNSILRCLCSYVSKATVALLPLTRDCNIKISPFVFAEAASWYIICYLYSWGPRFDSVNECFLNMPLVRHAVRELKTSLYDMILQTEIIYLNSEFVSVNFE